MNLSLRQLATFREVMRSGSISQAARTVGRTQPAVSSMIANLEKELGFALFVREHGRLTPTPEAHYFLEECEDILSRLDQTKRTLSGISRLEDGKLRIACHPAASGFFMPSVLTAFLDNKPKVDVTFKMRSSKVIEDLIASQQFDVGFAETPEPRESVKQIDFNLECVCAVASSDPLAKADVITAQDLDGANLAMLFSEHQSYRKTAQSFSDAGCRFHRKFELQTFLPGLPLVGAGLCYMICDTISAHSHLKHMGSSANVTFKPFAPAIYTGVSILTPAHSPQSIIAEAFCQALVERIKGIGSEMTQWLNMPKQNI